MAAVKKPVINKLVLWFEIFSITKPAKLDLEIIRPTKRGVLF